MKQTYWDVTGRDTGRYLQRRGAFVSGGRDERKVYEENVGRVSGCTFSVPVPW